VSTRSLLDRFSPVQHLLAALVAALVAGAGGWLVPRLIEVCPEPQHNPDENPEDFPDHVPFAEVAGSPGLAWRSALACAVAGAAIGGALGWEWPLLWLLPLVAVGCALTVIDFVTWYLPSRLIKPSYVVVAVLVAVVAVVEQDWRWLALAGIGFVALGGYYGLLWLVSPRIMAFGDVRLGALLGLALGPLGLPTLLYSVVAAALVGVLGMIPMRRRGTMIRRRVPFGPSLAVGAVLAVVAGRLLLG
jgi:leader peptidase (prepilin peptidase) / N-methyltransferase